jgi:hypothetical protein
MRPRIVVVSVLVFFSMVVIYNLCHEEGGTIDTVVGVARRITYGALFAIGFCSASLLLQKWMSQPVRPLVPVASRPPLPEYDMPTPQVTGRYRVVGVDHDTRFQTEEIVYADSPTNARLKVELKGVDVAAVEPA